MKTGIVDMHVCACSKFSSCWHFIQPGRERGARALEERLGARKAASAPHTDVEAPPAAASGPKDPVETTA